MTNHPNRGWRSRWAVDLEAGTASHRDGWVFAFAPADDDPTATDGRCIATPDAGEAQMAHVGRIAREAGEIFAETVRDGRRRTQLHLDDDKVCEYN